MISRKMRLGALPDCAARQRKMIVSADGTAKKIDVFRRCDFGQFQSVSGQLEMQRSVTCRTVLSASAAPLPLNITCWNTASKLQGARPRLRTFPSPSPFGSSPKTISSTRRQNAAITFGSSEDSPLVICISGPNSESVALRLTIM